MVSLISSHQKAPDLWTPRPYTSRLRDISLSLRINDMQHQGNRTFSTKGRPTTLGTNMPMDKDELNSAPPHMQRQSLAISVQENRLPPGGTWRTSQGNLLELGTLCAQLRLLVVGDVGIRASCLQPPTIQEGLTSKKGQPHKVVTPGTFLSMNHLTIKSTLGIDQAKTLLSNPSPTAMKGSGNSKRETGRL
jgi:hypothetical protein